MSVERPKFPRVPWSLIHLPPFPQVALRVLQLVSRDHLSLRQLSDLIATDQAFASEILMIANSPLYAHRDTIHSILQGIATLGLERIRGLALTVGIRAYLGGTLANPALRTVWRHSLACALIAEDVAALNLMEKGAAYTAGIMHDIGRVALAVIQPAAYLEFLQRTEEVPCEDVLQREREHFEIDHCEAGRQLVLAWHLPDELLEVVWHHHAPLDDILVDIPAVIRFSCKLAELIGFGVIATVPVPRYEDLLVRLPEKGNLFPANRDELAFRIATKINSIESP